MVFQEQEINGRPSDNKNLRKNTKFLVDKDGKRTHAVLPIKDYEELLEDMHDVAIVKKRRKENSISIAEMKKRL